MWIVMTVDALINIGALFFIVAGIVTTAHARAIFQETEGIVLIGFGMLTLGVIATGTLIVHAINRLKIEVLRDAQTARLLVTAAEQAKADRAKWE